MKRHWKIRNLENRRAYFVMVDDQKHDRTVLQQVYDFMCDLNIKPAECRIIETASRFVNRSFLDYVAENRNRRLS